MKHTGQDYSYALTEESTLIKVDNAVKGNKYYCPHCKSRMIPKQGSINRWHFAHKVSDNCCYESYLHKLAKMRFKECFETAKEFHITFSPKITCNILNCPINIRDRCTWSAPKTFEIKCLYDTCSIEKGIDGFIADLILTSSDHPDRPPILIEIFVTHKSTKEKINSGYRIIEIRIESEDDINQILNSHSIEERVTRKDFLSEYVDVVKFHNFNHKYKEMPSLEYQQPTFHFWIDNIKHYFHTGRNDNGCLTPLSLELQTSIFRIDANHPVSLDFAFSQLVKSGLNIKYCNMCKFYRYNDFYLRSLCILYKSKGTAKYPMLSYANVCPHFELKQFQYDTFNDDFCYCICLK